MKKLITSIFVFAGVLLLNGGTVHAEDKPFIDYQYYPYIEEVCAEYNICPEFVCSVIWHETRWQNVSGEEVQGLMQINAKWHQERMHRLGVNDLTEPEQNILVGVDYLAELFDKYEDPYLVLMQFNMGNTKAFSMYENHNYTRYAISVTEVSAEFERQKETANAEALTVSIERGTTYIINYIIKFVNSDN